MAAAANANGVLARDERVPESGGCEVLRKWAEPDHLPPLLGIEFTEASIPRCVMDRTVAELCRARLP